MKKMSLIIGAAAVALTLSAGSCEGGGSSSGTEWPCWEADGEPCDDDPLDTDDWNKRTKAPVKPVVINPPKPPVKPPTRSK